MTAFAAQSARPIEAKPMRRSRSDISSSDVKLINIIHVFSADSRKSMRRYLVSALSLGLLLILTGGSYLGFAASAAANPAIVVDAATGDVLYAEEATQPWFPASLTKLMTFYVALSAVRDHKISLDTPIMISPRAARAAPSKMGFKPGTELTLDNALKMLVVKSANDLAVAIAEAVSGSVPAFAEDMNAAAAKLGMSESHFDNPNGLPDPDHVSSAHDLAVLARAIYLTFPKEAEMFGIGALRLGNQIIPTHNNLLGRYPGVDGMKTGFTCAAGFNLIVTAQRDGHRYIAVVLGAPNVHLRMLKMAALLDRAFDGIDHPYEKLDAMERGSPGAAPDMHNNVCRNRAKLSAAFTAQIKKLEAPLLAETAPAASPGPLAAFTGGAALKRLAPVAPTIALMPRPVFEPVSVYLGPAPGYQGPVAEARPPHSPVGTAPLPEAASAYDEPVKAHGLAGSPLKPDAAALPLRGRHIAHRHIHRHHTAKAKSHGHHIAKVKPKADSHLAATDTHHKAAAKHLAHRHRHAGKLTKTSASRSKKHLHKQAALKGTPHKSKSTKLAAKTHERQARSGKAKSDKSTPQTAQ
ncbi:MAG: D-alanyl-D-alanine carboxypeptidase family protein [Methylovirgula sp.]